MPALSALRASAVEAADSSDTFVTVAETAALENGVPYLVVVAANTISTNSSSTTTETEATFGGSRYALARYRVGFSGAPSSGSGGQVPALYVVTGDGSSTVAVRHRRTSGTGNATTTAHIMAIPLDSLQEGSGGVLDQAAGDHWARSEAANSDTLTNPSAGSGWASAGQSVDVTPNATGNFLVLAFLEGEFTAGHSAADLFRARCRVTEDPAGTPVSYNLMRNTVNAIEGPESEVTGGSGWGNYALAQRWVDVLELTSGTTYRFDPQYEGVAGTANTGYRRSRVYVFDLSVWVGFAFARDVDGQSGQDNTLATLARSAPASAQDVLLLGALAHANGNTWLDTRVLLDPDGTPSPLPATAGFGMALIDTGTAAGDDYAILGLQWDRSAVSVAEDYAINATAPLQNCRWGNERGVFPGGVDDGVATVLIAWPMETSTSAPGGDVDLEGSASGSATTSGSMSSTTDLEGSASGGSSASASTSATANLEGASSGSSSASGAMSSTTDLEGSSSGSASASANTSTAILDGSASVAFIGNSYTQNYGGMPALLAYYLGERLAGSAVSLAPPPYQATSISQYTDGYFAGMTLGGMALFPELDQSQTAGSTDAVDHVLAQAADAYDFVVITSGFRQESRPGEGDVSDDTAVAREELPGAGGTGTQYDVCLEVARRVVEDLELGGSLAGFIIRMTQEGFNANDDVDLSDVERNLRLQVLAARQLEAEGVVDYVVPDHYVWGRLQWGKFGTALAGLEGPVPAYSGLTHQNSSQPGGANRAWLNRSQGTVDPFPTNGHQNAIATIVAVWTWSYMLWGIDPRGDSTFQGDPSGLPSPFDAMINPAGTRIYGGHNTGIGNAPYDTGTNPGGPPDSELDLDWSAATQLEIQDRIVAAVDDYMAGTTEFEPPGAVDFEGAASGSATTSGSMSSTSSASGSASGASSASGGLESSTGAAASASGTSSASASLSSTTGLEGAASGSSSASGNLSDGQGGSASGSSSASGTLESTSDASGGSSGASSASGTMSSTTDLDGAASGSSTSSATLSASTGPTELEGVLGATVAPRSQWTVEIVG